ncbi:MAG TPA: cobalamin-binding protein [Phycisphaerae bacterium]|nr:cobalamin-binding protein [Phycisphaerae bacterium]HRW55560.1 cobalamin-binding protein [Phycisphaerae bacterium]
MKSTTRWRRRFGMLTLTLAIALGVRACDRTDARDDASRNTATTRAGTPMRIVTLAPNAAESIAAIGLADRIVGVSDFCVFPESLTQRARVGGIMDPDLERIVTLDPDLVVLRGQMPTVEALCAKRGIDVYHDATDTLEDIFREIEALGERLGAADAAHELSRRLRDELDALHARVANRPRVRTLMIVNRDVDGIRNVVTFGRGAFVNDVIRLAGGENVFGELNVAYPQVSAEEILAAKPDVIIEAVEASRMSDALRTTMLEQWNALPSIPAVRNHRVYLLTEDYLLIPSPRVVDSVRLLSATLHPEVARE